jgi:hypothetical protein
VARISHRSVIAGIELEAYSIRLPDYTIGRQLVPPRRGTSEKGERAKLCWNGEWVTVPRYLDLFIEAIENDNENILAVQWHPECTPRSRVTRSLMRFFLRRAQAYMKAD